MFILVNTCFWLGIWLLVARLVEGGASRLLATVVVGFTTIVISLDLLSLVDAIRIVPVACICGLTLALGIAVRYWTRTRHLGQLSGGICDDRPIVTSVRPDGIRFMRNLIVGFASWAALDCLIFGLFMPVFVDSDAPIYHLPFSIHWAKVGTLAFVPTPFGEESAPYFPANGDLWLTWLTLTSQGAGIIKIGQWPFLVIGGLTLYAIARQAEASREFAAIVSAIWCSLPLALRQSSVANVDLIWTAFYFIALSFLMNYREAARRGFDSRRDLWLAALSLGNVLGTKSVGLAYAPLLIGPMIWLIWAPHPPDAVDSTRGSNDRQPDSPSKRGGKRRPLYIRIKGIGFLIAGMILPAGYWFARNFWMTGNPLYPLDVSCFGRRVLWGWYDSSAMRATAYHIPVNDWPVLVTRIFYTAGPCIASLWFVSITAGALGAVCSASKRLNVNVRYLSLLALLQIGIYWFVVPYNTQERFLLSALGIGLIPLASALTLWPSLAWPLGLVFLAHVCLALLGGGFAMDDVSFRTLRTLLQFGWGWNGVAFLGCLFVAGTMMLETRSFGPLVASTAILVGASLYGAPLWMIARQYPERCFYPASGFGARMLPAWQVVARASPAGGATIAYAGGNLPYYLLGANHRNNVVYVNINRHRDWLPHDYHKARRLAGAPDTAAIPWPQWYRDESDYAAWLENLRAARIDLLFVSRMNLHGRLAGPEEGLPAFPIERVWADAHPEEFEDLGPYTEPVGAIPWARVYRLRNRSERFGAAIE